jgi:branched-chain amino acid aminotransferase
MIDLAKARGFDVVVRDIKPEELSSFSECFLTGTAAEVTPVSEVGEHRFTPGHATLTLMDDYSRLVRRQPRAEAA